MQITILVGNIASGKSTLVKASGCDQIVSRDAWRYKLSAGEYKFDPLLESFIAKCCEAELLAYCKAGLPVIIDETNMTMRSRSWCMYLIPEDYRKVAIVFPDRGEESHVKARLSANHGSVPEATWREVYRRKKSQYQEPTKAEGFDDIFYL
jgi:predicted kinase